MEFDEVYQNDVLAIIDLLERSYNIPINKTITRTLFNDIQDSFTAAQKVNCSKLRRVTEREYRRVPNGTYFPQQLHNKAFNSNIIQLMCKCKIMNRDVEIRFGIPKKSDIIIEKLAESVQHIIAILHLCGKYSKQHCSKILHIIIILLDEPKQLPNSATSTIGVYNVNSGFSNICQIENEIVVYRAEEWFKVFIHETFHAFGLEGILSFDYSSVEVRKLFSVNSTMSLGEAYVEAWARILNASFASFLKSDNYNEFSDMLNFSLMIDCKFSAMQVEKVLGFMGLDYKTIYRSGNQTARLMYKENTNVFSYYILASILICNSNAFLKWCSQNNSSWMKFGDSDTDIEKFTNFITNIYKNSNTIESFINSKQLISNPGLRMSIIDV